MEIVVRGRNVEVPEHFRQKVEDKVGQLERFDGKVIRIDVELLHEKNPRQSANAQRVEITLRVKGPVARAEASAPDFYAALELAAGKRLPVTRSHAAVHQGDLAQRTQGQRDGMLGDRLVAIAPDRLDRDAAGFGRSHVDIG